MIFFYVVLLQKKRGQQSLKRPATDDRRPTPNPTNKLFQQTLNKQFDSPLLPDRYPIVYPFPGVTGFSTRLNHPADLYRSSGILPILIGVRNLLTLNRDRGVNRRHFQYDWLNTLDNRDRDRLTENDSQ